ncbi:TonB-dependent receptor [Temperatibacter marinus]|uniref:TonB-dependent receptor n=1 Tax=Temperatibacter marinus TaxID=1456591 RepID=A0AA52EI80_9PROT|nr:TonB-dependent receptor [Temperatibacter marinus]WND03012.1 TonB-dependent receptor [Temperatibacter marinus]
MSFEKRKPIMLGLMLSTAMSSYTVYAQEEEELALEEIVITATKRSTNLNDTAVAVTAITSGFADRTGLLGVQDVADFTPGMSASDTPNQIAIRGVGRNTNALGSDPGVALYLDGVYESESAIFGLNSLVVERVEVLRGPQGTLYGRNSVGGAVNIISKRPADNWEGEARFSYGSYEARKLEARITGPLTDSIRFSLAGSVSKRDGYQENVGIGNDKWGEDSTFWEAQLEVDITDNLSLWAKYGQSDSDTDPRHVVKINDYNRTTLRGSLVHNVRLGYTEANPSVEDPFKIRSDYDGYVRISNQHRAAIELTYAGVSFDMKYLYGSQAYDYEESIDNDYTDRTDSLVYPDPSGDPAAGFVSLPNSNINNTAEYKSWHSHEFQISSKGDSDFNWIVGAYAYKEDVRQPFSLSNPNNIYLQNPRVFVPQTPAPENAFFGFAWAEILPNPEGHYYFQEGELESKASALFGEISYAINENFTIKAGLRYSKDEKIGSERQRIVFDQMANSFDPVALATLLGGALPVGPTALNAAPYYMAYSVDFTGGFLSDTHEDEWDDVTGNLSVEYRPDVDTLVYGTFSKGYKSGGFRLGAISDDPATPRNEAAVDKETINAFELGLKKTFGDTVQLNAAAYYYDYKGLQAEVPVFRNGIPFVELYNADSARSMGLEAELIWQAGENTTVVGNYSFMDTEYNDFCGDRAATAPDGSSGCLVDSTGQGLLYDPTGNELNKAPKHKFALNVTHVVPFDAGDLSVSATYAYVDSQSHSIFTSPLTTAPSYDRADVRLSWIPTDSFWEVHATAKNVFDILATSSLSFGSSPYFHQLASYNAPRTLNLELRMKF